MVSEAKIKAKARYDKENTKSYLLKLNKKTDADILEKLKDVSNKQGYLKELVRKDLRSQEDTLSIESIRMLMLPVVRRYGIKRVLLIGSYARGEASKDSDVDLMISGGTFDGLYDYSEAVALFEKAFQKKTDLIMEESVQKDESRNGRRFRQHIKNEGILLYEYTD
ncbi:MAG: nucleotidyltransferase domain-containing protein [Lachnospiraceae bacterium]|nr:nucleotidyltransferase domain-containing protein [Lachnospiraceae bacterium]